MLAAVMGLMAREVTLLSDLWRVQVRALWKTAVGNSGTVVHFIICLCTCIGRPTTQIAGVAVREYGTVIPFGPDGTYMVFERLDSAEAIKRRGSDGGSSVGSGSAATKRLRSFALLGREVNAQCVWLVGEREWEWQSKTSLTADKRGIHLYPAL